MRLQKGKNDFLKRIILSKFFLIIGVIILVLVSSALIKKMVRDYSVNGEIKKLQEEINELEKKNGEFKNLVEYLNTEEFLEKEARQKFGLSKPGESVIIISGEEDVKSNDEMEELKVRSSSYLLGEEREIGNPEKWRRYFFNLRNIK